MRSKRQKQGCMAKFTKESTAVGGSKAKDMTWGFSSVVDVWASEFCWGWQPTPYVNDCEYSYFAVCAKSMVFTRWNDVIPLLEPGVITWGIPLSFFPSDKKLVLQLCSPFSKFCFSFFFFLQARQATVNPSPLSFFYIGSNLCMSTWQFVLPGVYHLCTSGKTNKLPLCFPSQT